MKRAQRLLVHTAVAASLALAASSAHAIPITFAFTGTVKETINFDALGRATYDPSHDGEAASGAIVVETDGLLQDTSIADFGTSLSFFQASNGGLFSSTLTIGGAAIDVGVYARDSGTLRVIDSSGPQPSGLVLDQVSVGHRSTNLLLTPEPLNGVFDSRSFSLSWYDPDNPLGLIDLSNAFDVLDVLQIPLGLISGQFTQQVQTCTDDLCRTTSTTVTNFIVGSFSVSAATVPVPEPGTLSLFLLGLLATAGTRSRRALRSSDRN